MSFGLNIFYFIYIQWNGVGPQVLTTLESALPLQIFTNNNTITNNVIYNDILNIERERKRKRERERVKILHKKNSKCILFSIFRSSFRGSSSMATTHWSVKIINSNFTSYQNIVTCIYIIVLVHADSNLLQTIPLEINLIYSDRLYPFKHKYNSYE